MTRTPHVLPPYFINVIERISLIRLREVKEISKVFEHKVHERKSLKKFSSLSTNIDEELAEQSRKNLMTRIFRAFPPYPFNGFTSTVSTIVLPNYMHRTLTSAFGVI